MRWVKASERLPKYSGDYVWRMPKYKSIETLMFFNKKKEEEFINDYKINDMEWLDESTPEGVSADAGGTTKPFVFDCILTSTKEKVWKFCYDDQDGLNQHSGIYFKKEHAEKGMADFISASKDEEMAKWENEAKEAWRKIEIYKDSGDRYKTAYEEQYEEIARLKEDVKELVEGLDWLLTVKDYKDQNGKDEFYEIERNGAWEEAKRLIQKHKL